MSVFNSDTSNPLETLVGEDKKFKTVEDLAKGKLESDAFILQLQEENRQKDEELQKRKTAEEIVAQIQDQRSQLTLTNQSNSEANQPAKPEITKEDLEQKVQEVVAQQETQRRVQQNVTQVAEKLVAVYGDEDKANAFVKQKAQELQVPIDYLQDVAARSPQAFYKLVELQESVNAPSRPTQGDVNTQAFRAANPNAPKANTYKWYQTLRRENPAAYKSDKIQMQMHTDALRLEDAFYE